MVSGVRARAAALWGESLLAGIFRITRPTASMPSERNLQRSSISHPTGPLP